MIIVATKKTTQVNIAIPVDWKKQLERLARIYSVEEDRTITFLDLMREAIREKFQLDVIPNGK